MHTIFINFVPFIYHVHNLPEKRATMNKDFGTHFLWRKMFLKAPTSKANYSLYIENQTEENEL